MLSTLDFIPILLEGALITVEITGLSLVLALIIGMVTALLRISNSVILRKTAGFYISLIRGTPLLVQLMYVYFVLPEFGLRLTPSVSAIIGLSLYEGAYLAEIFRAGIQSIGKGQFEAAYAIGMNHSTAMRIIILPQAIKNVLPPIGNSAILLLKNSSLAAVIAVNELMHTGELLATSTFRNLEIFTLVAVMYWLLHYPLAVIADYLERKMKSDSSNRH
ncbi:amino acid ABC transporter permease [Metallumcola ferriviriculae]|uniref:Amino acid ABC transporter permease n=1 Tax=Metallumcola ferriviriculae TaxID=3039180 RepID=A0AAU0UR68_9FIRM|nr:amino acid ABC transporter permease [Desulfitibacteraceae bacterium MK1]